MKRMICLTVALMLTMPILASAQRHRGDDRPKMMQRDGKMGRHQGMGVKKLLRHADELELSNKQRGELKRMMVEFSMQQIDGEAEMKKAGIRLKVLMSEDDAREQEVMRAIDDAADIRAELQKNRYRQRKAVMSVLSDEQRDKLKEMRGSRFEERRDGKKKEFRERRRSPRGSRRG